MHNEEQRGEQHPDRERHPDREEQGRRPSEHQEPGYRQLGGQPGAREQGPRIATAPSDTGHRPPEGESSREGGKVVDIAQQRRQAAGQAQQKTTDVVEQARQQARSGISTQMDRTAEQLVRVAGAVRQTGNQLRNQQQPDFANFAERAADQIDHFSSYLREKDAEDVVHEVENVARRQPLLFLGGTFIAGFLGARFLKSSTQEGRPSTGYVRRAARPRQRHEARGHPQGAGATPTAAGAERGPRSTAGPTQTEVTEAKKAAEKARHADAAA